MKCLLSMMALVLAAKGMATTPARSRTSPARVETQQVIPRDTLRAGQDIELRKVQAMLSRQGPPPGKKSEPRR